MQVQIGAAPMLVIAFALGPFLYLFLKEVQEILRIAANEKINLIEKLNL